MANEMQFEIKLENENKPNAIPSFQIKLIFKYLESNNSVDKFFLCKRV